MLLFYLRHGDPIYDPDSLTPLGKRQAEALGRRLSRYGIDEVFCSSSERAKQTAIPTCDLLKKEMKILDWSNENYAWEAFSSVDEDGERKWLFQNPKMCRYFVSDEVKGKGDIWYDLPVFKELHLEEIMKDYHDKIDSFMADLGYIHDRKSSTYTSLGRNQRRIALFAHQGFGMVFMSSILDMAYPEFCTHFDFGHTGMTVIDFQNVSGIVIPKVLQLSNDSHIYADGLPTKYQNTVSF